MTQLINNERRGEGRRSQGWKDLAIAILTTAVMTSVAGWVSFGRNTVSRPEMQQLSQSVQQLATSVQKLETTVAVLNDRLSRGAAPQP